MSELRVCQCGKPAGHRERCRLGPDDGDWEIERIDRQTEDELSERAAARWQRRKREIDSDRRQQRASQTTLALHREAVERAARLSTVAAGNIEPGRGGSDGAGPPRQQQLDDDPRWREHWTVIRSRLVRALELLDEAEGLGPVEAKTMLAAEKDQLILRDGEGLSPLAVVEKLGRDIAGSPETVRRVRRAAGRSGKDGHPVEERPAAGPVRRVVIDEDR